MPDRFVGRRRITLLWTPKGDRLDRACLRPAFRDDDGFLARDLVDAYTPLGLSLFYLLGNPLYGGCTDPKDEIRNLIAADKSRVVTRAEKLVDGPVALGPCCLPETNLDEPFPFEGGELGGELLPDSAQLGDDFVAMPHVVPVFARKEVLLRAPRINDSWLLEPAWI